MPEEEFPISSNLEVSTEKAEGSINDLVAAIIDMAATVAGSMADVESAIDNMADSTTAASDTVEANSQKQTISLGKINAGAIAVAAATAGMFSAMVAASPSLASAMGEIGFIFEEIFMILGESLAPIIEERIIPIIQKLADWFAALDSDVQTAIAGMVGIGIVMGIASGIAGTLATVIGALLGPIGLVILAIAALYIAWETNFLGIQDKTNEALESVMATFTETEGSIGESMSGILESVAIIWEVIGPFIEIAMDLWIDRMSNFVSFVIEFTDAILTIFDGFLKIISGILTGDWEKVWEGAGLVVEGFKKEIQAVLNLIESNIQDGVDAVVSIFEEFGVDISSEAEKIKDFITGVFDTIESALDKTVEVLLGIIDALVGGDLLAKAGGVLGEFVGKFLDLVAAGINALVLDPIRQIFDWVSDKVDKIPRVSNPHWEDKVPVFSWDDIPGFGAGGMIGETGLAYVHAGEFVIPADIVSQMAGLVGGFGAGGGSITSGQALGGGSSVLVSLTLNFNAPVQRADAQYIGTTTERTVERAIRQITRGGKQG